MTMITAVVAKTIINTGRIDFTFLRYAPPSVRQDPWGLLDLVDSAGSINPFKAMQENDWSSPEWRWSLDVYRSSGVVVSGGVDYSVSENTLAALFKDLKIGNFTLLVGADLLENLRGACKVNGLELVVCNTEKELRTSGNVG